MPRPLNKRLEETRLARRLNAEDAQGARAKGVPHTASIGSLAELDTQPKNWNHIGTTGLEIGRRKRLKRGQFPGDSLARPTGFEPVTFGFVDRARGVGWGLLGLLERFR
jgi:hypothetical protein